MSGRASFELLAFDLDGTLADTVADLHAAVAAMQRALALPASPPEAVRDWVGNGVERLVHRALTGTMDADAEPALHARALALFGEAYAAANGEHARLYPGVRETLGTLAADDVPLVIVTNKATRFVAPLLDRLGIDGHFRDALGGDALARGKPDPGPLLHLARAHGARPARSVMIGDSIADMRAARAAGFRAIGMSYGYNHGRPLDAPDADARPDLVLDDFAALPAALARLATGGDGAV